MEPIVRLDKVEIHQCRICGYGSMCHQSYTSHIITHLSQSKVILSRATFYKCDKCPCAFLTDRTLKLHKVAHVIMDVRVKEKKRDELRYPLNEKYLKRFSCSECDYKFVLESTLQMHMVLHEPYKYVCSCGIGYYKKKDLKGHIRLVHMQENPKAEAKTQNKTNTPHSVINIGDKSLCKKSKKGDNSDDSKINKRKQKQDMGTKVVKVKNMLKVKLKSGTKPLVKRKKTVEIVSCNCCDMKCYPLEMRKHAEEIHADVPYSCRYCYLRFTTTELLVEHQNDTHKKLSCNICGKKLMTSASLYSHLKLHNPNPKPYLCTVCGKYFTQKAGLNSHLKRHKGERNFKCKYCIKKFYDKASLEKHERTHTGDKPHVCRHCNKPFGDPSALKRHERIHTKEYRYFCTECPEKFTDASSIIRHRRKHDDQQDVLKFKCNICEKYFSQKFCLQSHTLLMHAEKQFECNECGEKYGTKHRLLKHIQKVHVYRFECAYCGKMFMDKTLLQKHRDKYHPITLYCTECPLKFKSENSFQAHKLMCRQKNTQKG